MSRVALRLVLLVVFTIVFALVLLTGWQAFLGTSLPDAAAEAARLLFLFMDVGLLAWVILLIIAVARKRPPSPGAVLGFAAIGVAVNLVVVTVVGFIQGGWAPLFVLFAVEAGIATLVAVLLALGLVNVLVKPSKA
jgi:hypothetical protein